MFYHVFKSLMLLIYKILLKHLLKIIKNAHLTFIETGSKLLLNNLTLIISTSTHKNFKKQAKNNIKLCFENRPKAHQKPKNISKSQKPKTI